MATSRQTKSSAERGESSQAVSDEVAVHEAENLYRTGRNVDLVEFVESIQTPLDVNARVRLQVLSGMAKFDLGNVVAAIVDLRSASEAASSGDLRLQFSATFAQFLRESDFLGPEELIPHLTRLRQLASMVGDRQSLAALHLASREGRGLPRTLHERAPTP